MGGLGGGTDVDGGAGVGSGGCTWVLTHTFQNPVRAGWAVVVTRFPP